MKAQKGKDGKLKFRVKKGNEKMAIASDKEKSQEDCDSKKGKAQTFGKN